VVGVVGLGEYDLDDLRDHSPWVMGTVVEPRWRGRGVGQALMAELEVRASALGYERIWVATRDAAGFYRRCGWRDAGTAVSAVEGPVTLLTTGS
jgi:N-acetylglutamate synthase-like GNAT family acetyltransferase